MLVTKARLLKALVWPVAVYGCESWTLQAGDGRRLQTFEMWGLICQKLSNLVEIWQSS